MYLIEKDFKDQRLAVFCLMQFLIVRFEEVTLLEAKKLWGLDSQKSMIAKGEGSLDQVAIIKVYVGKFEKTEWLFPNYRLGRTKQ